MSITNYKKKVLNFGGYSLFCVSVNLECFLVQIALKVIFPLLLDSNSSRDGTDPPFQFPIWLLTNKETKRQAITKDHKNEMKAKPIEF